MRRLILSSLRAADIEQLLADTLGRAPQDVVWLAHRVGLKSQHNPLLVRRFLFHLWDRDLIWHEHGRGWVWDEKRITEVDLTDDAADVVASRICELGEKARQLLETASLIGNVFEVDLLVTIAEVDRLDALQLLMQLVEQSLISPCREGFKFAHDRIREAARARIPESGAPARLLSVGGAARESGGLHASRGAMPRAASGSAGAGEAHPGSPARPQFSARALPGVGRAHQGRAARESGAANDTERRRRSAQEGASLAI